MTLNVPHFFKRYFFTVLNTLLIVFHFWKTLSQTCAGWAKVDVNSFIVQCNRKKWLTNNYVLNYTFL